MQTSGVRSRVLVRKAAARCQQCDWELNESVPYKRSGNEIGAHIKQTGHFVDITRTRLSVAYPIGADKR